jgi:hypothetical protein
LKLGDVIVDAAASLLQAVELLTRHARGRSRPVRPKQTRGDAARRRARTQEQSTQWCVSDAGEANAPLTAALCPLCVAQAGGPPRLWAKSGQAMSRPRRAGEVRHASASLC